MAVAVARTASLDLGHRLRAFDGSQFASRRQPARRHTRRRRPGGAKGKLGPLIGSRSPLRQIRDERSQPLLDAARVAEGTQVLDLCCGTGLVTAAVARRAAAPIGVD